MIYFALNLFMHVETSENNFWKLFGEKTLSSLSNKKRRELFSVYCFLKNYPAMINVDKFDLNPDEPIDVIYDGKQFQVTSGSRDEDAVLGKLDRREQVEQGQTRGEWIDFGSGKVKMWNTNMSGDDEITNLLWTPLEAKRKRYGDIRNEVLHNISLLIFSGNRVLPPKEIIDFTHVAEKYHDELKSYGYREIYILDTSRNIRIYQRPA